MEELEELKKSIDSLRETFDRGFESAEVQARTNFEQLVSKIDEKTLAETKSFDELIAAIEGRPNPSRHTVSTVVDEHNLDEISRRLEVLEKELS